MWVGGKEKAAGGRPVAPRQEEALRQGEMVADDVKMMLHSNVSLKSSFVNKTTHLAECPHSPTADLK